MIALAVVLLLRRRKNSVASERATDPTDPVLTSVPLAPDAPPATRPRLELSFEPRRGGLNIVSITVEGELVVRNIGEARCDAVLVEITLLAARSGQDEELGNLFARPITRPAVPAFALGAGEERRVRVVAALPLAAAEPLSAGGRAMLVPVLAANIVYHWARGEGQTAATYLIGVAREGQTKLAPFWLDTPGMHDALSARPHALAVTR